MSGGRPGDAVPETSLRHPGWRVAAGCFVMALCAWGWGFYGHSVYVAELTRIMGWSTGFVAGATTAYSLAGAALIPFVGELVARLGPRRFVLLGAALLALSVWMLAGVETKAGLLLSYLVMTGGWACLSGAAVSTLIGLWFDRRRGLALSLAMNGASAAGVIVAPALVASIHAFGFGPAMRGSALILLVALVLVAVFAMGPPPTDPSAAARAAPQGRGRLLRSRAFWAVSAPFCLALFVQAAVLVHLVAWLAPWLGPQGAAFALTAATGAAILGRFALGALVDRIDQRRAAALSMLSQCCALALMLATPSAGALYLGAAIYGFSVGNLITLPALIVQREFPAGDFARVVGLATAVQQFAYAFGPGATGLMRDAAGGYGLPLSLLIGLEVLAAGAILALRPRAQAA